MRKVSVFVFTLMVLAIANLASAKTLKNVLQIEIDKTVHFLNMQSERNFSASADFSDDEPFKYDLYSKNIIYRDLNNDNIKDAIVSIEYCEKLSCHLTTHSLDLTIFLGKGKSHFKHHSTVSVGMTGAVRVDTNGIIDVVTLSYSDTDPHCCPSKKTYTRFAVINNKLIKISQ